MPVRVGEDFLKRPRLAKNRELRLLQLITKPYASRLSDKNMRQGFYECIEHNRKNRKKAIDEMPYASKVVAVVGGYMGFESWDDYEIWKNQK